MPDNIQDEDKWNMAKKIASKEGQKDNYKYIAGVYKKMGGRYKNNEKLNALYKSFKESNEWNYTIKSDGAHYMKQNGFEKWHIHIKNNKVVKATKEIQGKTSPLNKQIVDEFKKKLESFTESDSELKNFFNFLIQSGLVKEGGYNINVIIQKFKRGK